MQVNLAGIKPNLDNHCFVKHPCKLQKMILFNAIYKHAWKTRCTYLCGSRDLSFVEFCNKA